MRLMHAGVLSALLGWAAALPGCSSSDSTDPNPPPVATVTITGPDTVAYGATVQFTAVTRDASGSILTGRTISWTSSNSAAAAVTGSGTVAFVGAGTAVISATSEGVSGTKPVRALGLSFTAVAAGQLFACGLTSGGDVYCWGSYSATSSNIPVRIPSAVSFVTVAAGQQVGGIPEVCGLTPTGTAYCWTSSLGTATAVPSAPAFTQLSLGAAHACGVGVGALGYCWGYNNHGQLGTGTPPVDHATPTAVVGGLSFLQVSAGVNHTCGTALAGAAYCWGSNGDGEVGSSTPLRADSPQVVGGGLTFSLVTAGGRHSCGLVTGGAPYCWGRGAQGQLGTNSTASSSAPLAVAGGMTASTIDAGLWHTCAVAASGGAYCWGDNGIGQLGIGTTASDSVPRLVAGGLSYQALALGQTFSCGLTTGGRIYCWGSNQFGELGVPSVAGSLIPVRVAGQE